MIRQGSEVKHLARVLSKKLISWVVVGVEPVDARRMPTFGLSHAGLFHRRQVVRVPNLPEKLSMLSLVVITTKGRGVSIKPVQVALHIIKVSTNNRKRRRTMRHMCSKTSKLSKPGVGAV